MLWLRDGYAEAEGLRLHYVSCGRADAPLMLFLHGFPEHCRAWDKLLPDFASDWNAVAVDLPGYNLSDKPESVSAYRVGAISRVLVTFVRALGYERCVLVGHDWGGAIGWYLACTRPCLVAGFVAINAVHPTVFARELRSNPLQREASRYIEEFRSPGAEHLLSGRQFAYLFEMFESESGRPIWLDRQKEAAYLHAWNQPGSLTGGLAYYRASTAVERTPEGAVPNVRSSVLRAEMPILVIWGERDRFLLKGNLDSLDDFAPLLRVVRLPQATHWVVHEETEEVSSLIEGFAAELLPALSISQVPPISSPAPTR